MTEYFNRSEDKVKRRVLRREIPLAERLLWARLRDRQVCGLKFRRQYSVGCYVVDFYCPAQKLAIEIDGESHSSEEAQSYDRAREAFLHTFGIRILRFPNAEIYYKIDSVIEIITCTAVGFST